MTEQPRARLLIVDHETAQMQALCDSLAIEGYRTRGYSSAQQALAELQPGQYELLITDLKMPDIDGIALADAVRRIDPALPTILMTGHGTIDSAVRAMQDGALDYILKPFKLNVILSVIARALDVQRLRRENAELRERERRHSEELAAAYRDLESFSYSISHDLRAPLRAIGSFGQMLSEDFGDKLGADGNHMIQVIRDGVHKLDQLIVGLLEFSRAGRQPLDVAPIDMTALASVAIRECLSGYAGSRPAIELDELPAAIGDATGLRQVWCNLIGNALKYSSKRSEPQIHIRGRIEGRVAFYQVEDNGAGFDMRYADKLFGVFQRLHGAAEFAGIGVGLAIVQRIVARHGGCVSARGAPDAGACFEFSLPLAAPGEPGGEARGVA